MTYHPLCYNSLVMIKDKTVFVLGAGASCPYGFPSGKELRLNIISGFVAQYERYLEENPHFNINLLRESLKAKEFTDKFDKSSTKSIDLFLSRNPEFVDIGKMAIALRILDAEHNSKFRERIKYIEHDWYSYLFDRLTDDIVNKNDYVRLGENSISFITFNYDRSLDYFLYESLINSFNNIPPEKIKEQLIKLKIIHVFGQVAALEWQDLPSKLEYRFQVNRTIIPNIIKNIRTIYEEEENPELEEVRNLISEAKHIYFLGFGYAKENMMLLNIPEILNTSHNIYGTALGLTKKEIREIQNDFSIPSQIEQYDCLKLLRQYM